MRDFTSWFHASLSLQRDFLCPKKTPPPEKGKILVMVLSRSLPNEMPLSFSVFPFVHFNAGGSNHRLAAHLRFTGLVLRGSFIGCPA
jgi:hypothetical protein